MAEESTGTGASKRGRARKVKAVKQPKIPLGQLPVEERQQILADARAKVGQPARGLPPSAINTRTAFGEQPVRRFARMKRAADKILYFVPGAAPTEDEYAEALTIGPGVVFRNATKIVPNAPLENCDFVAGPAIPDDYRARYTVATPYMALAGEDEADIVSRPRRVRGSGMAPDDVRPGTVDTGEAHASGTGSSQPGVQGRTMNDPARFDGQKLKDGWRTAKLDDSPARHETPFNAPSFPSVDTEGETETVTPPEA